MAARKAKRSKPTDPMSAVRQIKSAADTSSTVRGRISSDATAPPTYNLRERAEYIVETQIPQDEIMGLESQQWGWEWVSKHWVMIAGIATALGVVIWNASSLSSRVGTVEIDVKDVKGSVDKLKVDAAGTSVRLEQVQRSVGRLEDLSIRPSEARPDGSQRSKK